MFKSHLIQFIAVGIAAASLTTTGCRELPGSPEAQGATIGGVGGAAAGAAVGGSHHWLLGALLGGAVGAGGGYLIGANADRIRGHDSAGAKEAVQRAQQQPVTPEQALRAATADVNGDGFVTMDEVVAMKQAGLPDQEILERMRATGQVFELNAQQQDYLRSNGVDDYVIEQIPQTNRELREQLLPPEAPAAAQQPIYPAPNHPVPPPPVR